MSTYSTIVRDRCRNNRKRRFRVQGRIIGRIIVIIIIPVAFFLLLQLYCSSSNLKKKPDFKINRYYNDLAAFYAGLPVSEVSKFQKTVKTRMYKRHIELMSGLWNRMKREVTDKIRPWSKKNIPKTKKGSMVFYPLSGADFINMFLLFPDDNYYLMVALEDPGSFPDPEQLSRNRLYAKLISVRRFLYHYSKTNYFQSKVMANEMRSYRVSGVAPIIMIFIVWMGLDIISYEDIGIDKDGNISVIDERGRIRGMRPSHIGCRIRFCSKGSNVSRTLVYVKMKLSRDNVNEKTPAGKFINKYKNMKTLMKAAVYLLHYKKYQAVLDFILDRSVLVVQDDSGVPYRAFNRDIWDVRLYGEYRPYYPFFNKMYTPKQKDLMELYKSSSSPLPFCFGYGAIFYKHKSNLMIAEKRL